MPTPPKVERGILVFSVWAVLGFLGLGFLLEGFAQDSYLVSLVGTGLIAATFVGHIIINDLFAQGFTQGETALGLGAFGVLVLTFVLGWLSGQMSTTDFYSGLTLFGMLVLGFLSYLATRYGLRGAFSRFHFQPEAGKESRR
ncbi:MAG: hypothetical protein ACOH2H_21915 [Cypionkella sp.]